MNVVNKNQLYFLVHLLITFVFAACKEEAVPLKIDRFEQNLFSVHEPGGVEQLKNLSKQYGVFYQSFAEDMLNISNEEAPEYYAPSLLKFINYPTIKQLKKEVDSVFPDLHSIESELGEAMILYRKFFPDKQVPKFISFISEFGYANVTYDSIVGIGLDMYLGNNYVLYHALEFPEFMIHKLRKEYIVPNAIKSMAIGKYEHQLKDKRFIAMMLFEGKVRYFMKQLMPELNDTILFGYTAKQMEWCKESEQMIWTHLVEQKLIYSSDVNQYMRYFNDGPFTSATGVPQDSAPAIGVYAGYQIISKYMRENSKVSLEQLMENPDWEQILKKSKYRPEF